MMRTFLKCAGAVVVAVVWGGVAWGQPVISPPSGALPGGEVGVAYNQTLTASELPTTSPTCCTWAASGLPNGGLNITFTAPNSPTAQITGTPTAAGPVTFTVTATDVALSSTPVTYTVTIIAPSISPPSLPPGEQGAPYNQTLSGSGGSGGGYTVTQTSGSLPSGLIFTPGATATITGTPGAGTAGSYPITVTVTDSAGGTASQPYTILINPPPSVSTSSLPQGEVTAPYSQCTRLGGMKKRPESRSK